MMQKPHTLHGEVINSSMNDIEAKINAKLQEIEGLFGGKDGKSSSTALINSGLN
jgi:hypothetical protein